MSEANNGETDQQADVLVYPIKADFKGFFRFKGSSYKAGDKVEMTAAEAEEQPAGILGQGKKK